MPKWIYRLPALLFASSLAILTSAHAATTKQCADITNTDSPDLAVQLCEPLTKQGNAEAQFTLGLYYLYGPDSSRKQQEGARLIRLAAEQGYTKAQLLLGTMLSALVASGTEQDMNFNDAAKWITISAQDGFVVAQYALGIMHLKGKGVSQNPEEAIKWLKKAAKQNFSLAQGLLGSFYYQGKVTIQDYDEAAKWFKLAANQDDATAQMLLGNMHALGQGVEQNYVKAHMWLNIAASSGNERAIKVRDMVASNMTPNQINQAQKLAREWLQNHRKP